MWVVQFLLISLMFAAAENASGTVPPVIPGPRVQASGSTLFDYRPEICAYCNTETWCELRANNQRQCRGCKVVRFFSRVLYPPLGYELIGWQAKVLRDVYGTVRPEDGLRRYTSAFIEVAKKNGKSFLIGGMPLYNLLMEDELNPEAYGAAAAKDQAGLVFKAAQQLVNANPYLLSKLKVLPSTKRIIRKDRGGFYAVISADGELQDGIEPSLSLRDELHRWKTARSLTLRDVMTKGQISRREPLDIVITTAGAEYESPLWLEEYEQAKRVIDGSLVMDSLYVAVFEPDLKRLNSDSEYWKSREARVAANPSHEDLGGFLRDSAIAAEMQKALANPRAKSKYFRYNLNVPVKQLEDPIIEPDKWQACGGGIDVRKVAEYQPETLIEKWNLAGQQCWIGVDASWTTDLTAAVAVFPPFDDLTEWTLLPFFWMPAERVDQLERTCRVPFSKWIEQGFITQTDGGAIDLRSVIKRIEWATECFEVVKVSCDRYNFRVEAMNLVEKGIPCEEVQQNFAKLSAPTKFLLSIYPEGKLRHANNPVLNWMASCLQLQYDQKDNCQPSKPERMKSSKRIDGIQGVITALHHAMIESFRASDSRILFI